MRPKTLFRRRSRLALHRLPDRRGFRPRVELLESRVVPTTIDYSMGFANHANLVNNGSALFTNTVARLTDGQNNQAGSIFTNAKFDITRFTTSFTFVLTGTNPIADGITFTIEN